MAYNHKPLSSSITDVVFRLLPAIVLTFGTLTTATTKPVTASEPAPRYRLTTIDISLLRDLIDGHSFAVQMSQLCVQKATLADLKSLCQQVISTQQQQIQTMQSWLSNWYGITYTPTPNKFSANVLNQLAALNGDNFNIAFMETLTSHHWGAIEIGGEIIDRTYHQEFVNLATNVITSQVGEINQLRSMLHQVYGISYNGAFSAGSAAVDPERGLLDPQASGVGTNR